MFQSRKRDSYRFKSAAQNPYRARIPQLILADLKNDLISPILIETNYHLLQQPKRCNYLIIKVPAILAEPPGF